VGLNPFEFRAGIYFYCSLDSNQEVVLIPLNSGLVFTYTVVAYDSNDNGLNPFEFRAGIYFKKLRVKT